MKNPNPRLRPAYGRHRLGVAFAGLATLASLTAVPVVQAQDLAMRQEAPRQDEAVLKPSNTNMNVAAVVLACEQPLAEEGKGAVQLQLFLTDQGPLKPVAAHSDQLKPAPRAEVAIDGTVFPVEILFADTFAMLADDATGVLPALSPRLVEAMQRGNDMKLRFDMVADHPFDGDVAIDLKAAGAGPSVAAVRHCAAAPSVAEAPRQQ